MNAPVKRTRKPRTAEPVVSEEETYENHAEEEAPVVEQHSVAAWEGAVDGWKASFGDTNVHLAKDGKEDYIFRGLGRLEFRNLSEDEFRNEDELENAFVLASVLWPAITAVDVREKLGGFVPNMFEAVMNASNVMPNFEPEPTELDLTKDLPESVEALFSEADIREEDLRQWFGRHNKVYYVILEGKLFVYRGLRRSEFEQHKEEQRNQEHFGPKSEEVLVSKGLLYPYRFEPLSNDVLFGTVTLLYKLVNSASGYNDKMVVTTL
jgi:hypothetical protein